MPGVGLAVATTSASFLSAAAFSSALAIPLSGIPVSILSGLALKNTNVLPPSLMSSSAAPGLKLSTTTLLRAGIVCVGMKLSFLDLLTSGLVGIPVVVSAMSAGFLYIPWASQKAGLSKELGSLLATGTTVCGVTAITAASPIVKASKADTAVAVANVVAFGTLGMLSFPYLAHHLFLTSPGCGTFLGVAIHDTSQVLGAGASYAQIYDNDAVLKIAAVTKLTRNLFLAGVVPGLAIQYAPSEKSGGEKDGTKAPPMNLAASFVKYTPGFVLGFVGASLFRSAGDATLLHSGSAFGCLDGDAWKTVVSGVGTTASTALLGTAMAAVGLSTSKESLKGVGAKPFLVGGSGALVVGGTGCAAIKTLEYAGIFV
ncbi:hypothetical protein TeGR_g2824 [Tetraparma gracilis]|uniref:Uncharacterized protein n=1 Tax=Tetraparma gracilis TaxID=2962635 RepID=A0ABQ6NBG6_9STRA|nr:hypothetical protein TeGR_g2824 [Tetraparma gracilis]